ncbi:hypothetical protein FRC08_005852 [Ceratobasidium sp. 394]|nr:hypothetical protein FRC08_005852 [Ceratobasidium sp. 394]KAG9100864.1 hypothetical protein FS749_012390 [Ceratobasidium sp. UAMH 11750]
MAPRISLPPSSDEKPRSSWLTPARAGIALIVTILLALFTLSSSSPAAPHLSRLIMTAPSGWHSRAMPHPDGAAYDIQKENVIFGMTRNARVEPSGFSVALFKPNVAIDAMGRVYVLNDDDFSALVSLASEAAELPNTGGFRNQWRVKHDRTGYPIDQLYVATSKGLHTIGVYGHDGQTTTLEPPVHDITNLPAQLNSIITLAKEGRDGFERGTENAEVVSKVKAVLNDE